MTLDRMPIAPRLATRGRAVLFGAAVALACSACASDRGQTVATAPAGGGPAVAVAPADDSSRVASAPLGYPWATGPGAASLPTASARAPMPTVTR